MSTEIIAVLDEIAKRFGVAVDWTSTNVVPYLEQLSERVVSYKIATSIFYMVLWICIPALFYLALRISCKRMKAYHEKCYSFPYDFAEDITSIILLGLLITVIVIAVIVIAVQAYNLVVYNALPEKAILEFLGEIKNSI